MSIEIKQRLEYLRGELRAERISYGELSELQSLVPHIEPGDMELLEAAGVPEEEANSMSVRSSVPFKKELYSVAARKLTPEELMQAAYLCARDCRIFHEDPRVWPNYDVFIGHQISKYILEFQINELVQIDSFIQLVYERATDV